MYLILLNYTVTYLFLGALFFLFFFFVGAWFFTSIDKKSKILNRNYILGKWHRKGMSPTGELWSFEFDFDRDKLVMSGTPEFIATAKYRITREDENLLTLELYGITGDTIANDKAVLKIAVDKKKSRLTIDNRSGYVRI